MILDAKERERLAQRARELFAAEPVDYAAAVPVLRQAAALGDPWCLCTLGWCCEFGQGTEKDMEQALWLYEQGAQQEFAPAQCNLAVLYITGKGVANPVATFWTSAEMLEWLGEADAAKKLLDATERVCEKGIVTADLGGTAKTVDVTNAVIEEIKNSYGKSK